MGATRLNTYFKDVQIGRKREKQTRGPPQMWANVAAKMTTNQRPDTGKGKEEMLNRVQAGHANETQVEQGEASPEKGKSTTQGSRSGPRYMGGWRHVWEKVRK
jgi:hypothetical protein